MGGHTCRSEGNPRVSHSAKDPVTWTVEVSGLTTKGSRGMPDEKAVAMVLGGWFLYRHWSRSNTMRMC